MKMNIKHVKRHERRHLQYTNCINWINYAPPVRRMIKNGHGILPKKNYTIGFGLNLGNGRHHTPMSLTIHKMLNCNIESIFLAMHFSAATETDGLMETYFYIVTRIQHSGYDPSIVRHAINACRLL